MTQAEGYVTAAALKAFSIAVFRQQGLSPADAAIVSDCLVKANLRGLDSHGVSRIPIYVKRLNLKLVNPTPAIRVDRVAQSAAAVDGDDGMGMVVATRAMAEAIDLSRETGVGLAGVKRSTHYGMAAYYVLQAVAADCIGFAFTNSSPGMAPWGGSRPVMGVNPLAVGIPAGKRGPIVIDMAMSVMARGKLRLAGLQGTPIPTGLGLDACGRPTTDGLAVFNGGTVLPFGGPKGSALAIWMEVMGGVLTGAAFAGEMRSLYEDFSGPQRIGHVFMAVRPDLFLSLSEFKNRMDLMIERYSTSPTADGVEKILMPGEPEARAETQRSATGIPIGEKMISLLKKEGQDAGVPFPKMSPVPLDDGVKII